MAEQKEQNKDNSQEILKEEPPKRKRGRPRKSEQNKNDKENKDGEKTKKVRKLKDFDKNGKPIRHMTEKEKSDWDELYKYIRSLLGYSEEQSLSNSWILRLRGIHYGKFLDNKNTKDYACVGYDIMLMTLRLYAGEIQTGLSKGNFENEDHRFNYICKIMDNHLNDTYRLINNHKSTEDKINRMLNDTTNTETARDTEAYDELHKDKETTDESLWGDL